MSKGGGKHHPGEGFKMFNRPRRRAEKIFNASLPGVGKILQRVEKVGENFLTSLILFDSPKCNVFYSFKGFGVVFLIFHPKAPKNCSGQRRGGDRK